MYDAQIMECLQDMTLHVYWPNIFYYLYKFMVFFFRTFCSKWTFSYNLNYKKQKVFLWKVRTWSSASQTHKKHNKQTACDLVNTCLSCVSITHKKKPNIQGATNGNCSWFIISPILLDDKIVVQQDCVPLIVSRVCLTLTHHDDHCAITLQIGWTGVWPECCMLQCRTV